MRRAVVSLVVLVSVVVACGDDDAQPVESTITSSSEAPPSSTTVTTTSELGITSTTTSPPASSSTPVTDEMIRNTTVQIDGETVALSGGEGEGPPHVRVVGTVIGDVTGDGVDDGAAILAHDDPGTTGRFSSLVVFHQPGATLLHTEPIVYVDRGRTHDLRLDAGAVVLRWSERMFFDGEQTTATYEFREGELEEIGADVSVLLDGGEFGLRLDQTTTLDYGSTEAQVRAALVPLLGEPDEIGSTPTCWGEQSSLDWVDGDERFAAVFLGDEWFQWIATDDRFATEDIFVIGARLGWVEQWLGESLELYTNELSGQRQSIAYGGSVSFEEDTGEVIELGGQWESDYRRLHTEILDPFENPDIWCGD